MTKEDYLTTEFELTPQNDCGGDKVTMEDFYKSNIATNNLIIEDYCSNEISKLLNEKGFKGPYTMPRCNSNALEITLQTAMKWLREKYHIHIMISIGFDENKMFYHPNFAQFEKDRITYGNPIEIDFSTCEEAVEAALKYSLENLI